MGILDTLGRAARGYAPGLFEGADKIEQSHMRTAQQNLDLQQRLGDAATPVSPSTIGPSFQRTQQITPDLPAQVSASMQAPRPLELPDFAGGPSTMGPSYTPQQDLPSQIAGTGAKMTAPAPVDAVHPSRMFHYGGQDYVLHTPDELRAIGNAAKAAATISEMTSKEQGASEARSRYGTPTQVPSMIPGGEPQTINMLPEEAVKTAERSIPVTYRNVGSENVANIRGQAQRDVGAGHDQTRVATTEDTNATREEIAAGRNEAMKYAVDSRRELGLSALQIRSAQLASKTAAKTGDPDAMRKIATVVSRLQQHRAKINAALTSGVVLDNAGFQVPLKPEGKANLQAELDATDKNIAGFQQTATQPNPAAPAAAPAAPQFKEGQTATNPQTKEQMVFRGGKWVPQASR